MYKLIALFSSAVIAFSTMTTTVTVENSIIETTSNGAQITQEIQYEIDIR